MENAPGGYGVVSVMAGSSRKPEPPSNEGGPPSSRGPSDQYQAPVAVAVRPGKSNTRNEPTRRPDVIISQRPVPSSYLNRSLANPSPSLLPTPFRDGSPSPLAPTTPPGRATLLPGQASSPPQAGPSRRRQTGDEIHGAHDAIPPLYNEAWKATR
ncbi:hypothetical protein RSOLAG1IB_12711 [Rhizoctonia solani AG-1 IB]|uniref:Uncharacterized protein n=1 Tax=Thanatephorus cucumeris (strain AG1-IB / isolate 7/3/14) TaxID=1108050 RepID=A0A0B7G131_THACB|nr:hypothetical protein RSOLAG1IB_12711 [Rhizoctonia solani AG-1 IB]